MPSRWQNELSERLHFSAEDASRHNAFMQYIAFLAVSVIYLIQLLASSYYGLAGVAAFGSLLVAAYSAAEGLARWTHIKGSERACGFPMLEFADLIWLRYRAKPSGAA